MTTISATNRKPEELIESQEFAEIHFVCRLILSITSFRILAN